MANTGTYARETQYRCQICHKFLDRNRDLKIHIRIHTGKKQYKCQVCQKAFAQSVYLKRHMITHTSEKPYHCQLCQKSFTQCSTLKRHMITHTSEKPYRCQICHKSFAEMSNLKRHMRTHTHEKPHRCLLCQKSFMQMNTLKRHMRIHMRERPQMSQLCQKRVTLTTTCESQGTSHDGRKTGSWDVFNKGYSYNMPYAMTSSSVNEFEIYAGTQPKSFEIGGEVTFNLSDHLNRVSNTDAIEKPDERFSRNTCPDGGISGLPQKSTDGECLNISELKSHVDGKFSLSKSFGCGICDKLLEIEKEFFEHCSGHGVTLPDDLFADQCCIMFPHN